MRNVSTTKGVKLYFQPVPWSEFVTIPNPWHSEKEAAVRQNRFFFKFCNIHKKAPVLESYLDSSVFLWILRNFEKHNPIQNTHVATSGENKDLNLCRTELTICWSTKYICDNHYSMVLQIRQRVKKRSKLAWNWSVFFF